jgi:hypothetical protein
MYACDFVAPCPGCGRPVRWFSTMHVSTDRSAGGQPKYRIACAPCDRRTPYLGRAA